MGRIQDLLSKCWVGNEIHVENMASIAAFPPIRQNSALIV